MKTFLLRSCFSLFLFLFVVEAGHPQNNPSDKTIQKHYTLRIGISGGFTGLANGYTLHSTGKVEQWRQMGSSIDSTIDSTVTTKDEIDSIRTTLMNLSSYSIHISESGNLTSFIEYSDNDSTKSWSWAGGGSPSRVPKDLQRWYQQLSRYSASLFQPKSK